MRLPAAGLRAASRFRTDTGDAAPPPLSPAMRRALRDTLAIEVLADHHALRDGTPTTELIAETIEYLIELSGTRVESHELTHGVVIADVFTDAPRLRFDYPADLQAAKRAPLLFDGQRSLLLVDTQGHPRFELQRHRLDRLRPGATPASSVRRVRRERLLRRRSHPASRRPRVLPPCRPHHLGVRRRATPAGAPPRALDGVPARAHRLHRQPHRRWPCRRASSCRPPTSSPPRDGARSWPSSATATPSTTSSRPRTATTSATSSTGRPCDPRPACTT